MIKRDNPLFSVIIPYYNKRDTIRQTVMSVLGQSFQNFELIIVDDGSTDNFNFSEFGYDCIRVIKQNNKGVSEARNRGIIEAKGKFICFLDADDLWKPNHLSVLHDMINKFPDCSYFCTSHCTITDNGQTVHSAHHLKKQKEDTFLCKDLFKLLNCTSDDVINTNSICIKKSIIMNNSVFFEPGITNGEDCDMWFRVALLCPIVITKTETTEYVRMHSTASRNVRFVDDWIFTTRVKDIEKDSTIEKGIRESCLHLVDRYYMSGSRYYKCIGDTKKAMVLFRNVTYKAGFTFFATALYLLLPDFIARKVDL